MLRYIRSLVRREGVRNELIPSNLFSTSSSDVDSRGTTRTWQSHWQQRPSHITYIYLNCRIQHATTSIATRKMKQSCIFIYMYNEGYESCNNKQWQAWNDFTEIVTFVTSDDGSDDGRINDMILTLVASKQCHTRNRWQWYSRDYEMTGLQTSSDMWEWLARRKAEWYWLDTRKNRAENVEMDDGKKDDWEDEDRRNKSQSRCGEHRWENKTSETEMVRTWRERCSSENIENG